MIDGKSQSVELKFRSNILPSVEINQNINYGEQLWRHRIDVDNETIFSKEWYFQYHGQGGDGPSPFPEGVMVEDNSRDDPFVYDVKVRKDEFNEIETSIQAEENTLSQSIEVEAGEARARLRQFVDFSNPSVFMEFSADDDSQVVSCESFCEENIFVGGWMI